ncbi:MAG: cupin domain-containing protein [Henriciella sp.]
MRYFVFGLSAIGLAACSQPDAFPTAEKVPPPGSNEMLRAPISGVDGIEVLISDVVIPPNATVPRHYHPGEEFLYVISGSAIQVEEGKPDQVLEAGDAYVIPPNAIHEPRGGPQGARAIVFRVHVADQPERILVPTDEEPTEN